MVVITGGQTGTQEGGHTLEIVMVVFLSIGLSNSLELFFHIFLQFKSRRGLYFWSMVIATIGIPVYTTGFCLKYWGTNVPWGLGVAFIELGWVSFVTGQSVLLYSRLHLVLFSRHIMRLILIIIIFDAIVFHGITIIATVGSNSPDASAFVVFYTFIEKLQMTVFSIQETIISGTYIWATIKFLTPTDSRRTKIMRHLIYVNVLVIFLDLVMLGLCYADSYELETTIKPAIYSIKMKLEFAVLNHLLRFSRASVIQANGQHRHEMSTYDRDRKITRRSSRLPGPPEPTSHEPGQLSHNGILRTTTVIVGTGEKENPDALTRTSQGGSLGSVSESTNVHGLPCGSKQIGEAQTMACYAA